MSIEEFLVDVTNLTLTAAAKGPPVGLEPLLSFLCVAHSGCLLKLPAS